MIAVARHVFGENAIIQAGSIARSCGRRTLSSKGDLSYTLAAVQDDETITIQARKSQILHLSWENYAGQIVCAREADDSSQMGLGKNMGFRDWKTFTNPRGLASPVEA